MTKTYFKIAGILCFLIALLHVGIILGGPDWYRFFGAGEGMAQLAEKGSNHPTIVTSIITLILIFWGFYAFAGAELIRPLPLMKVVLSMVCLTFISRGLLGIPMVLLVDDPYLNELQGRMTFMMISSLFALGLGLLFLPGTIKLISRKETD